MHNSRFLFTDINSAWKEPFAGKYISLFYKAFLLSHNVVLFIFCYINVDNQVECLQSLGYLCRHSAVVRVEASAICASHRTDVREQLVACKIYREVINAG